MISYLELENYRGFQQYKLAGLARVNLLVGKNNSGKTSLLEAVQLLASGGDPLVLSKITMQRGEVRYDSDEPPHRGNVYQDVSHFFYGREFGQNSHFAVRADNGLGKLDVSVVSITDQSEKGQKLPFSDDDFTAHSNLGLEIRLNADRPPSFRNGPPIPVSEEGALSIDQVMRHGRRFWGKSREGPVQFVTQDSLERGSMSEMWDKVITEGKEQDVVDAMRILEPTLTSIAFMSGDRPYRVGPRGGILVGFEGTRRRQPLGSYGEGMRRLLALSLALATTQNGILLIDEIDTGLHYSIMGDMWLLVVEAARRYNIQVFITTHSFDCVRGLSWLCKHHPELGKEVSLQKIEHDLNEAVALDAEQIIIAADQDIEVR